MIIEASARLAPPSMHSPLNIPKSIYPVPELVWAKGDRVMRKRIVLALCVAMMFVMIVPSIAMAGGTGRISTHGLTAQEQAVLNDLNYDHAWQELAHFTGQERLVGSSQVASAQEDIYSQFVSMGMDTVSVEHFGTKSWVNGGTTVKIVSPVNVNLPSATYADSYSIWGLDNNKPYYLGNSPDGKTLTAPVVDCGKGTNAELTARGDLTGRIALVQRDDDQQGWPNVPVMDAAVHGAVATVFYGYYDAYPFPEGIKQDVVEGPIPAISISINSANVIKDQLATGATVQLSISGRADLISDKQGHGTNVIAYMRGSKYPDQYVVFSAHIDNWWGVASDDTSGIAVVLELARTFSQARASGQFTPERTLVFCSFDGEEYGGPAGGWYNWLIGSYEFVKAHRDLVDRTVVDLNLDMCSIPKSSGKYWLEQSADINVLVKPALDDLGMTGQVGYYNPAYSWVDAWSFHAKGGTSSVNAWWVVNQDEVYHTACDNLTYSSIEPMKIILRIYTLLGMRASQCLVLPINILDMANYAQSYLTSDAALASKDCGYFTQAQSALNLLKTELTAVNSYSTSLLNAYAVAKNDAQRAAVEAQANTLNNALYAARKTMNTWTMGEGGTMGSWDVFPREHQHSNDISAINSALAALSKGRTASALGALETVYDMEWGHLCSNATYNWVVAAMYNNVMYWGGEWDQQQAYVNVLWIYNGLKDGTLSSARASAVLNDIKTTQLDPWLLQDLVDLQSAWLSTTNTLGAVV